MGYSYTIVNGRAMLDCDSCGGYAGVVKRKCPVVIGGLPCCPAAALCTLCFNREKASGAWAGAHEYCRVYARRLEADNRVDVSY